MGSQRGRACACGQCGRFIYAPAVRRRFHAHCEYGGKGFRIKRDATNTERHTARAIPRQDDLSAAEIDRLFDAAKVAIQRRREGMAHGTR